MNARFTIDGSEALEQALFCFCAEVAGAVEEIIPARRLEGLLLGGGYGRGEGGVLRTPEGDRPYNDLEFYVLIEGLVPLNERRYRHALARLGARFTERAGIEVEFKILSRRKLRQSAVSMFYYDLVMGHRQFLGGAQLLAGCEHHAHAELIPLYEATRLMMNRCSGLLFALKRLRQPVFEAVDGDFVGRNLAKAQLAFGDVILAAHGRYHFSCRVRAVRLKALAAGETMPWLEAVQRHHRRGVEFKLHPVRSGASREELRERHAELAELGRAIWLWLEERRLRTRFDDTCAYAASNIDKCPETSPWRNRLIHLRTSGFAAALRPSACRYPRQQLFHDLATLLWAPQGRDETDFSRRVDRYAQLWHRFN